MTKDQNFYLFLGPKWQKTGPLRPMFSTHLKVLAISMWSNNDVKPVKTFWENDQDLNFDLFWGPKWSQNWASDAHNPHTTESICNEHVKQYWCETSENFLRKWPKSRILIYFGVQNGPKIAPLRPILNISLKSSSNEHIKQDCCESRGNFLTKVENCNFDPKWPKNLGLWGLSLYTYKSSSNKLINQVSCECSGNFKKIDENLYIDLFWPYLGPKTAQKFGPQGPFFKHTWKYLQCACKPSFLVSYQKLFEKMAKKLQNFYYLSIFFQRSIVKIRSKKSKFHFHHFLDNIAVHIQAKYRKDRMKTFRFEKSWRTHRQTDGRHTAQNRISSTYYVSSGAKNTSVFPSMAKQWNIPHSSMLI